MRVGSLKLAGMQFNDVSGRIVIGGGNLAVENARTNLYGGTFAAISACAPRATSRASPSMAKRPA
jgi:hypothetical protein